MKSVVSKAVKSIDNANIRKFFASKGISYLESNRPTVSVAKILSKLRNKATDKLKRQPMAKVKIAFINPSIGYGCFADEEIKTGQLIGEYTGILVGQNTGRQDSHYAMQAIPESIREKIGRSLYLSAAKAGNELRFVNHLGPQVKTHYQDGRDTTGPNAKLVRMIYMGQPQVHMVAIRQILPGDEIRITYNWSNAQFPNGKSVDEVYSLT
jgi:SET domain-containing protein